MRLLAGQPNALRRSWHRPETVQWDSMAQLYRAPSHLTVDSPEPLGSTGSSADAGAEEFQTAATCGPCRAQPGGRARNPGSIRPCDRAGAVPRALRHLWRPSSCQQRLRVGLRSPCARHMVPSPHLPIRMLEVHELICYQRRTAVWLAAWQIVGRCINCRAGLPGLFRSCLRMPAISDVQARVKAYQDPGPRLGRHVINDQGAVTKAAKFVRLYKCRSARPHRCRPASATFGSPLVAHLVRTVSTAAPNHLVISSTVQSFSASPTSKELCAPDELFLRRLSSLQND